MTGQTMPIGTIKRWNADSGFGFISDDALPMKRWSFVHITALNGIAPDEGDAFSYELVAGRDGRETAVNLVPMTVAREEADRVFGRE